IIQALRAYARHMADLAPTFPEDKGNDKLMPEYERILRMLRQANLERTDELTEILERFKPLKATQYKWPGRKAQAKEEEERWNQFTEKFAQPAVLCWREKRYEAVLRVLRPAVEVYDRL